MARNLLGILGYDPDSPAVRAGRRHSAVIARLIDGLVVIREKRGLKQSDVAERMDTTQSSVSNFERQGGDPKLSTVLRYADAIGAEIDFAITDPVIDMTRSVRAQPADAVGTWSHYRTSPFEVAFS